MIDDVRANGMMAHLLDSLERGEDIGHYGRLVFVMVARHFAERDELVRLLTQDRSISEAHAREVVAQVEQADYSPPRRDKIIDFQSRQDFPILTNFNDPDEGNVYKDLHFPDSVYAHIGDYREAKARAEDLAQARS
jgi:hypothetical protein